MKLSSKIGIGLVVFLLFAQLIRREKNISTADFSSTSIITITQPTAEMATLLKDACFDCHSNTSKYPWYSEVAPLSWWIQSHINGGKQHLNFEEWGSYPAKKAAHKLEECIEMLENKNMPLKSYTWLHPEAQLSEGQRSTMIAYFKGLEQRN